MVTTNGCIKFELEPTQWRSPSYFCWEWRWFFIPTRWTRKVVIYNYVLCWLYSMTKNVIIALFCSLYFVGFYCIGFSIKLVKNWVRIEEQVDFMRNLWEANSQKIFKCDFLTLHSYYIYPHYPQKYEEVIQREKL